MMEEEEELEMIDILSFESNELIEKLGKNFMNRPEEEIMKYLAKQSQSPHFPPVEDFKQDLDWFNVTEPLSFQENLQGKVVVLDFFTYCCINCMHILPDLRKLEERFSPEDGLVVVGVHSAKFTNEKDSANILSAVQRYNVTHPIVNDPKMSMWRSIGIKCWPTLLVLGPTAKPIFILMGEGHGAILTEFVQASISFFKKHQQIRDGSLPLSPSTDLIPASKIKFPGKIEYWKGEGKEELLAVSDSGNNRILIVNAITGDVVEKIGGTSPGFQDGNFESCRFNSPQGVAFQDENTLFVADTENHAIRKINRAKKMVETIAGTGKQGNDRIGGKTGINQAISSPWDICVYKTKDMDMSFHVNENDVEEKIVLLVAMAGSHQIWGIFLDGTIWWKFKRIPAMSCSAIIGNGSEENRNNSYPQNAGFAQPSGITVGRECIYIADSESSSIRRASLLDGKVSGVVGGDRNPLNLFAFGDVDGKSYNAKLQHPLGVAYDPCRNQLYVADTYNHKIKVIDPSVSTVVTCPIADIQTFEAYQFNEPAGLCLNDSGTTLYVADTNNHCIQLVDLQTLRAKQFNLRFEEKRRGSVTTLERIKVEKIKVNCIGGSLHLNVVLKLDGNIKLTEGAPQSWKLDSLNKNILVPSVSGMLDINSMSFSIDMTLPKKDPGSSDKFEIKLQLNACSNNLCFPKSFILEVPLLYGTTDKSLVGEELMVYLSEKEVRI